MAEDTVKWAKVVKFTGARMRRASMGWPGAGLFHAAVY
jgi:hypothetical protein